MKRGIILFVISLCLSLLIMLPSVRRLTMGLFVSSHREILSTLDFREGDQDYRILKIQTPSHLLLELYKSTEQGDLLLDSIPLADKRDASFKFAERSTNLFLKDIDGDGQDEVIAPSLDKNLSARLHIFRWNKSDERLEKMTAR